MIAEVLKSEHTGCSIEECRHGIVRDGAQSGTVDPMVINNSQMVS